MKKMIKNCQNNIFKINNFSNSNHKILFYKMTLSDNFNFGLNCKKAMKKKMKKKIQKF